MQQDYNNTLEKNEPPPYYHQTMMYHTAMRNVGLHTSLTLGAMAAARALMTRGHTGVAVALVGVAMLFLGLAVEMNRPMLWPTPAAAAAPTSRKIPWIMATAHALIFIAIAVAAWRGSAKFRL